MNYQPMRQAPDGHMILHDLTNAQSAAVGVQLLHNHLRHKRVPLINLLDSLLTTFQCHMTLLPHTKWLARFQDITSSWS